MTRHTLVPSPLARRTAASGRRHPRWRDRHGVGAVAVVLAVALGSTSSPLPTAGPAPGTPVTPPGVARPVVVRGGVLRAGDSKTACIYASLGHQLTQAEASTGIHYDCLEAFLTGSTTWAEWVQPWITNPRYGYTDWVRRPGGSRTLVLTINLVPNSVAKQPGWRARCAAGRFDADARLLARNLAAADLGRSVIRLGKEMNGPWELDWIGTTKATWHAWAGCFAHLVRAMRAVPGAHLRFDWNVNANYEDIPLQEYYPGDDVVDIIGIDAYDEASIVLPPVGSPQRWAVLSSEPLGLDEVAAFARAHHKPLSIPEWGTLGTKGDDGAYVTGIGRFVATHDVAYQCWYDAGNNHIFQLSARQAPRSLAAYRQAFA